MLENIIMQVAQIPVFTKSRIISQTFNIFFEKSRVNGD